MVVGAGRGPLVRRSLLAADAAGVRVRVYAVEKNANAVVTLRNAAATDPLWSGRVTVVARDMRGWEPPGGDRADVLVSELLGSFGDNELSPECLDGAQRLIARPHGVSVPFSYTSYLAPVTSSKLWTGVRAMGGADDKYRETPFVVAMRAVGVLDRPQRAFTFVHPFEGGDSDVGGADGGEPPDNRRHAELRFAPRVAARLHGFAGYFEAVLLPLDPSAGGEAGSAVTLSTLPSTHTPGMFSWFPIFFPLREPVRVGAGHDLRVRLWRCVGAAAGGPGAGPASRVWYEWAAEDATTAARTHVHNAAGKCYSIGL